MSLIKYLNLFSYSRETEEFIWKKRRYCSNWAI